MPNSIVLSEALSIPEKINKFILNDNNNYQEVSKLISEKKIDYVVTWQEVLQIVRLFICLICLQNILVYQHTACPHL